MAVTQIDNKTRQVLHQQIEYVLDVYM